MIVQSKARTNSLIDHFEGDIASIVLKKQQPVNKPAGGGGDLQAQRAAEKCKKTCNEYIESELSQDDQAIESVDLYQIALKAASLNDMVQLLKRVSYVNKETYPTAGARSIKLATTLQ
jgi:hypothetical protein